MRGSRASIAERRQNAREDNGIEYAARRAALIRAATEVFRSKGYAAATLNDVAAAIGADRASLYYYVASKDELFQECIHEAVTHNIRDADVIAAGSGSPAQKLHDLIALLIRSQELYYPTMFVYLQEDMSRLASKDSLWATNMIDATRRFEAFFLTALDEGIRDGTFRPDLSKTLVANAVFGMTLWTHRWWVPGERFTADQLVSTFTSVLFAGITADDPLDDRESARPSP